ncbi:MAG TPA: Xaa-Pro peptidase family protein [Candidatus Caenarcaniphilales bacterium]|nr:Xaa-Pro peptidase family protein [Candidatus Caenarcaniphilales bacterium]
MSTRSIPAGRYAERLERVQQMLPAQDASAVLVGVGADLLWLTGYSAMPLERLTMLVLPAERRATLIVPRLEVAAAETAPAVAMQLVDLVSWEETEDPFEVVARLLGESNSRPEIQLGVLGGAWGRLGGLLVSDRLWATFLLRLQAAVPDAAFGLASSVLSPLRAIKDAEEVELLRRAAHAADRTVAAVARGRLVGRTEADVAREVRERLVAEGHDEAAFWIVASGPNSASPHHEASDRVIQAGEPIVLDIGGRLEGYGSDITRTLWVTGEGDDGRGISPDAQFLHLYEVLQRAQAAAIGAVSAGIRCEELDAVARRVIDEAGFGPHFIHRTGHGIGLEGHEDPYLVAGNEEPLTAGHAFSVEPGIYLEGRCGARIEDIVVCGPGGADVLNEHARDLLVVRGT